MVKVMVDYEDAEPEEIDLDYPDMDPDFLSSLAMSGDQGAIDYLNQQAEDRLNGTAVTSRSEPDQ